MFVNVRIPMRMRHFFFFCSVLVVVSIVFLRQERENENYRNRIFRFWMFFFISRNALRNIIILRRITNNVLIPKIFRFSFSPFQRILSYSLLVFLLILQHSNFFLHFIFLYFFFNFPLYINTPSFRLSYEPISFPRF